MDADALKELLEEAGLSPYQASAYVKLLDLGAASATQLAQACEVPAPRIYDVLRELEQVGYVETYQEGSLQVRAHSPGEILDDLRDRANRLEAAAEEIDRRWEQPEIRSTEASIVKRFRTVYDHARTLIESAENQVQLSVTPEQYDGMRDTLKDAHDRGVFNRVSVHTRPDETPPPAEAFEGVSMEVRHRPIPAPFIALIDRTEACFAPHEESFDSYGVLVEDQTHAFVFHWFFLSACWEFWDVIFAEQDDDLPVTYVDIRQCIRDIEPMLEAGQSPPVAIEGVRLPSGEPIEFSGQVVGADYQTGPSSVDVSHTLSMAGRVTMRVVAEGDGLDGEEITVGGWGAVLEDIEAKRITLG